MAILSTAEQAALQSAIDLLVNGTAYETPISEDVLQRIAPTFARVAGTTTGEVYALFRDNPTSSLIGVVLLCGDTVLTTAQRNALGDAIEFMLEGTAYERPFAEDIIQRVAPVASSIGFLTTGGFYEAIRNAPVSTMLKWSLKLGSI